MCNWKKKICYASVHNIPLDYCIYKHSNCIRCCQQAILHSPMTRKFYSRVNFNRALLRFTFRGVCFRFVGANQFRQRVAQLQQAHSQNIVSTRKQTIARFRAACTCSSELIQRTYSRPHHYVMAEPSHESSWRVCVEEIWFPPRNFGWLICMEQLSAGETCGKCNQKARWK